MKRLFGIFLLLLIQLALLQSAHALLLIPQPRQVRCASSAVCIPSVWECTGIRPQASFWLEEDLKDHFGICLSSTDRMKLEFLQENQFLPEEYELSVRAGRITLRASSEAGFFRGTGRLLAILKQAVHRDGENVLPELFLRDYPSFPHRGMTLQMPFSGGLNYDQRLLSIERSLDYMATHGFNFVIFEVGASFSTARFKSPKRMPWKEKDLTYLVSYARKRGLEPIPAMNTIGHVARAAEICPLYSKSGKLIGMDIRRKDFFDQYRIVLDELLRIFASPRFFHIGCDENAEVFRQIAGTPSEGARLYAGTVNLICQYLRTRNCRTVIWHDMLSSAWDSMTRQAISDLSRDVIIDVWLYDTRDDYQELDYFVRHGFETWTTPWNEPGNIRNFIRNAWKKGLKTILGSTWNCPHKENAAFVLTAEYAWNPEVRICYDPVLKYMEGWQNGNVFRHHQSRLRPLDWQGGRKNVSGNSRCFQTPYGALSSLCEWGYGNSAVRTVLHPDEFNALKKMNSRAILTLSNAQLPRERLLIDCLNAPRTANSVIVYTSAYGATTRNNQWGLDCRIVSGKVTQVLVRQKNVPIPSDGFIVTSHGGTKRKEWMYHHLKEGTRTELNAFLPSGGQAELHAVPDAECRNILLVLGVENMFYVKNRSPYGFLVVDYQNGREDRFAIMNDYAFEVYLNRDSPFSCQLLAQEKTMADAGLLVHWRRSSLKTPGKIRLEYTPLGIAAGLKILSSCSW